MMIDLLTPTDVAHQCQVSTKTVLRAIHQGRLRASRLGARGAYRISARDVDEWIAASAIAPRKRTAVAGLGASSPRGSLPAVGDEGRLVVSEQMGRR